MSLQEISAATAESETWRSLVDAVNVHLSSLTVDVSTGKCTSAVQPRSRERMKLKSHFMRHHVFFNYVNY